MILTIAPVPLSAIDAQTYAARQMERQEQASPARIEREKAKARERAIARFQALTPDTALSDYLDALDSYTHYAPDEAGHEETLAKGRRIKSRQADVVTLLKEWKIGRLEELWNLDIAATPAVCEAYRDALRRQAGEINPTSIKFGPERLIERQLPNIEWLVKEHCDLFDVLAFTEIWIRELCDKPNYCLADVRASTLAVADTLAALRRPH